MADLGVYMQAKLRRLMEVNTLILTIERKIPKLAHRAFKLHQKFDKVYRILHDKLIRGLAHSQMNDLDDF